MSDIKSFIEELKQINETEYFNVFVPSINKKVKFKAFSVKQHKDLIKSIMSGVEGNVNAYKVFNDIIIANSLENIDFMLYDRNKILVDLRRESVSNLIKIDNIEYDLNNLPEFEFNFPLSKTFTYKNIQITAAIPSLKEDSKITEKSLAEFNKFSGNEDKKAGDSLNILLIYEIIKFIHSITIDGEEINLSNVSLYDKKNLVDNLPLRLNNDILDYIAQFKEYDQALFTFSDGTKLSIDASFLSTE